MTHPGAYIAWSDDPDFTADEFLAGLAITDASEGAVPARSGFAYLALWLEAEHWDTITQVTMNHGPNLFSSLEAAVNREINGVAGQYRRFTDQLGDRAVGQVLRWQ